MPVVDDLERARVPALHERHEVLVGEAWRDSTSKSSITTRGSCIRISVSG